MKQARTSASAELAARFVAALERAGIDFYTGVPCSLLASVWTLLEHLPEGCYVPAVREDSALGIAAGAWLGGRRPCVLMQNSGLGVSVNALASLHLLYEIPALLVVTWRGEGGTAGAPAGSPTDSGPPEAFVDAPEHWIMGEIMPGQLEILGVPWAILDPARIEEQVREATGTIEQTRRPVALIVRRGIFDGGH